MSDIERLGSVTPDEKLLREAADLVTAACDAALLDSGDRCNDGRLWYPLNADNLLMAAWQGEAPDMERTLGVPEPRLGSKTEVTGRYWYGLRSERVNIWLTEPGTRRTFTIDVWIDPDSGEIDQRLSVAGYDHDSDAVISEQAINTLLQQLLPGLASKAIRPAARFYEGLWRRIEEGAPGYTREEFHKVFMTESKDGQRSSLNGFTCSVEQVNRSHLQGRTSNVGVRVSRHFWGGDYGGLYDGILTRRLVVDKDAQERILGVHQDVKVRLFNQPYVQSGQPGLLSEGPVVSLPSELQHLVRTPLLPTADDIAWFVRLATQPVADEDLRVF